MSLQSATAEVLPWVKAELNYLAPTGERPRTYTYEPPAGVPRSTTVNEPHGVQISRRAPDRRKKCRSTRTASPWCGTGAPCATSTTTRRCRRVYYPEVERC